MPDRETRQSDSALLRKATGAGDHDAPVLLDADPNHRTGTLGPVFFVVWQKTVEIVATERVRERVRAFAALQPSRRAALLTVVESTAPMPSANARTALANILRYCADDLIASAVVMEGGGFRASAVRSVATGLAIVARQPFPHLVFPDILSGSEWLAARLLAAQMPMRPAWLATGVAELRAMDPRARAASHAG